MQLRRYEALMLAIPEITNDEVKLIENNLNDIAKSTQGSMVSFERWGKFRLSYPVNRNDYGVYILARFEAPQGSSITQEVQSLFAVKLHELVSRATIQRLPNTGSLVYHRPKSLEEAPSSRDVDRFLKDNNMTGLLKDKTGNRSNDDAVHDDFTDETDADHYEDGE